VIVPSGVVLISLDILPIFFMNIGAGLLDELAKILGKVCETGKEDKKVLSELKKCIAIHVKIKRFITTTEKQFTTIIFVQGSMRIFILCLIISQLSKINSIWSV
jgi:2-hydroxy-3-keto-5-methylthiopentenyl-1-phosphate phosphatase